MVSAYVRIPLPLRLPVKIFQRQRSQIFCRGCLPGCPAAALWPSSGLCGLFLCRCRFPDRAGEGQRVRQRLPRGGRLYLVPSALCASCEGFQRQRSADLLQRVSVRILSACTVRPLWLPSWMPGRFANVGIMGSGGRSGCCDCRPGSFAASLPLYRAMLSDRTAEAFLCLFVRMEKLFC